MSIRTFIFLLMTVLNAAVSAQPYALGAISIEDPWSRELPPVAPNGAAYLRVENGGNTAARIVSAHSPVAGRV